MSTFTDLEKDAASVDGFVNENGLIPTRRNGPKPSYQYLVDEMRKSRGFRVVGTFVDGFTYELFNDVGIDADGNSWIYVGAGAPNKVVAAGTVPSVSAGYEQVTFNSASVISDANGGSVQDYIDENLTPFKTIADMKSAAYLSTLPEFTRVEWQGYYAQSDGGSNWGVLRFGAHTEDGGSIFSIDANTYIEANLNGKTLNPLKFGAKGDGGDDTIPIQKSFDTALDVKFTPRIYGFTSLEVGGARTINLNGAKLTQITHTGDAITVSGDGVMLFRGEIESTAESNNDGLRVTGKDCVIKDLRVNGYFYSIDVAGDNCTLDRTCTINSYYAGVRLNITGVMDRFTMLNHVSKDYKFKGFVVNGKGTIRQVLVDNYKSSVDGVAAPADAMNGFLVDTDEPHTTHNVGTLIVKNSDIRSAGSGNKILNVAKVQVENTNLHVKNTYASSYGLYTASIETDIREVTTNDRVQVEGNLTLDGVYFEDCEGVTGQLINIRGALGDFVNIKRIDYSKSNTTSSTSVIRLERDSIKDEYIKFGDIRGDGASDLLTVYTQPTNTTSYLEITGSQTGVPRVSNSGTIRSQVFRRVSDSRRVFGGVTQAPTTGAYLVGDVHPKRVIGNFTGYSSFICVTAGNPGVWKEYGAIDV